MERHSLIGKISENKKILKDLAYLIAIIAIGNCGGSAAELKPTKIETGKIIFNVLAEYSLKDTTYRAHGDMIKKLTIIDNLTKRTRYYPIGEKNTLYKVTDDFSLDNGEFFFELIDAKGHRCDTTISISAPGKYTLIIPIVPFNLTPVEIDSLESVFNEGNVSMDP